MEKYDRQKESKNFQIEITNSFDYFKDMKCLEIEWCTKYKEASRCGSLEELTEALENWQKTQIALYNERPVDHKCSCFKHGFEILVVMRPSVLSEMWNW